MKMLFSILRLMIKYLLDLKFDLQSKEFSNVKYFQKKIHVVQHMNSVSSKFVLYSQLSC